MPLRYRLNIIARLTLKVCIFAAAMYWLKRAAWNGGHPHHGLRYT